ncbi:DUF6192 family protein [Actinosynnema sp. CA-248983]
MNTSLEEVGAMPATMVGHVTRDRYEHLVAHAREMVERASRAQFAIGDAALEIEPLQQQGGARPAGEEGKLFGVSAALEMFADDIGLSPRTVAKHRWVASRWPVDQRRDGVSYEVHRVLASIAVDKDRFAMMRRPPLHPRSGTRRWTPDAAKRLVGWQVERPVSVQEKVERIHDLARDDAVASRVAADFLRRPTVAFKAMTDPTAKHAVNRAQVEQSRQAVEVVRQRNPQVERLHRSGEFVELVGACTAFVAGIGRAVPALRGHTFSEDERATVHRAVARVRASCDWVESAVDTGNVSLDEGLARLLRGE